MPSSGRNSISLSNEKSIETELRTHASMKQAGSEVGALNRRRSRSVESRRNKSKGIDGLGPSRSKKRKANTLEEDVQVTTPEPQKFIGTTQGTHSRSWKRKGSKYTMSTTRESGNDKILGTSSRMDTCVSSSKTSFKVQGQSSANSVSDVTRKHRKEDIRSSQVADARENDIVERLEKELVVRRLETAKMRETSESQVKTIEELKNDINTYKRAHQRQVKQLDKLKKMEKKSGELSNAIRQSVTCQICLELLIRPYLLSPCGHVYCQTCLQQWFQNAPRQPIEEDREIGIIDRIKTCPCCRAEIFERPIQIFIVKDIVMTIDPSSQKRSADIEDDSNDPWSGIFGDGDEDSDYEEDSDTEYDNIEEQMRIVEHWEENSESDGGGDSEEDSDDDSYLEAHDRMHYPRRTPPTNRISSQVFHPFFPNDEVELVERGATITMIEQFRMRLDHDFGIVAWLDDLDEVYLGWNIELRNTDSGGRKFMEWVKKDIVRRRRNWRLYNINGHNIYRRRVPEPIYSEVLSIPDNEWDSDLEYTSDEEI